MFLPVQIPTVVELQRPQGGQGIAGLFAPVHTLMFLSAGDQQVIAFFDMGAANVLALRPTFSIRWFQKNNCPKLVKREE